MNELLPFIVSIICGLLLFILIGAFILSAEFRNAVLGAQGEASVAGILSVKGVAIVLLAGLFLAGLLSPLNYIGSTTEVAGTVATAPLDRKQQMVQLIGIWEAQIPDNNYHMQVNWNSSVDRYEGRLLRHSDTSQYIGYQIRELIWTATIIPNTNELREQQKIRLGQGGKTIQWEWQAGTVDLNKSTHDNLVTSFASFRRIK